MMIMRNWKIVFLLTFTLCSLFAWRMPNNDNWENKIDTALKQALKYNAEVDFLVLMHTQADVSGADFLQTKEAKGSYVFSELKKTAEESQRTVRQLLEGEGLEYHSFYIVNAIRAQGDTRLIESIAKLPGVASIQHNPSIMMEEPIINGEIDDEIDERNTIEWGVEKINAPAVWSMGFTGQGVVVAGEDTGYDWEHPTIKSKYRGWNGTSVDHNYNWHDAIHEINPLHGDTVITEDLNPCGLSSMVPCDDHNHGTHTMGTMVGDDGQGNQIGVAPGASWMACRNMERGYGSPASYIECFEFFLAPTNLSGTSPDPSKAPHVINNSWSCPEMEGCNAANWATMEMVVNNLKSAGIVVVVSAGNSGSNCGTVQAPAAMFENSFTVGASRSNDTIANFSSRGAVIVDGSNRMKPNIVAPGVGVRSATRNGGYATWNGTSMAGPHVAGLVALIISAVPELAGQVETIETIIEQTAKSMQSDESCGGVPGTQVPNNTYGFGRVDALAAVQEAMLTISSVYNQGDQGIIQVYPNPVRDHMTFHFKGVTGRVQAELFNASGQPLYQHEWIIYGDTQRELEFRDLPAGLYYYRVSDGERTASGKIIKQ